MLPKKNTSGQKFKKMNVTIESLISLSTKSQLKLTIFIFWAKFVQKRYFQLKTEKSEHHH